MASIYPRGRKLWAMVGKGKNRRAIATKYVVGQEEQALKAAEAVEDDIEAGILRPFELGPLTVERYAREWIADRKARHLRVARHDEARLQHALPRLGSLKLDEVRPHHVRDLVRSLVQRCGSRPDQLAPRTVRHVYATLRKMFNDAVADELLSATPCVLKRGELPKKVDKHPTWRSGAVYTREEVERLISDARIPLDRRVYYGLLFLTGMRPDEAVVRRWRDYDPTIEPLGKLVVATAWDRTDKVEKGVKTENPRDVPVHPTLARILAAWKLSGWEEMMTRPPAPDDFIIPSRQGRVRNIVLTLRRLYADLDRLGMRRRRQYDSRRTFISLARGNGASKDTLRWVTHGPEGDIMDDYTTMPWTALCAEVAKLRIELREGKLVELPKAVAQAGGGDSNRSKLLQELLHPAPGAPEEKKTARTSGGSGRLVWRGVGDSNPWPPA